MIPDRLTIRLGSLRPAIEESCDKHGLTPSELIREAVAAYLGVDVPELEAGNPNFKKVDA